MLATTEPSSHRKNASSSSGSHWTSRNKHLITIMIPNLFTYSGFLKCQGLFLAILVNQTDANTEKPHVVRLPLCVPLFKGSTRLWSQRYLSSCSGTSSLRSFIDAWVALLLCDILVPSLTADQDKEWIERSPDHSPAQFFSLSLCRFLWHQRVFPSPLFVRISIQARAHHLVSVETLTKCWNIFYESHEPSDKVLCLLSVRWVQKLTDTAWHNALSYTMRLWLQNSSNMCDDAQETWLNSKCLCVQILRQLEQLTSRRRTTQHLSWILRTRRTADTGVSSSVWFWPSASTCIYLSILTSFS